MAYRFVFRHSKAQDWTGHGDTWQYLSLVPSCGPDASVAFLSVHQVRWNLPHVLCETEGYQLSPATLHSSFPTPRYRTLYTKICRQAARQFTVPQPFKQPVLPVFLFLFLYPFAQILFSPPSTHSPHPPSQALSLAVYSSSPHSDFPPHISNFL